jgi:hypothetical protein
MCIKNQQNALGTHYTNYRMEYEKYEIKLSCLRMCDEDMSGEWSTSWADHIPTE